MSRASSSTVSSRRVCESSARIWNPSQGFAFALAFGISTRYISLKTQRRLL